MKKISLLLLSGLLLTQPIFASAPTRVGLDRIVNVEDRDLIVFENSNERYLPARKICVELGMSIKWNNGLINISDNEREAIVTPGKTLYTMDNGSKLNMKARAILFEGVSYLPLDFWSEGFNYNITETNGKASIYTDNPNVMYDDIITPAIENEIVNVFTNQTVGIQLESNPSTGYVWEIELPEDINVKNRTFSTPEIGDNMVGVPGYQSLLLKPTEPGKYELVFNKKRTSEKDILETKKFYLNATDFLIPGK